MGFFAAGFIFSSQPNWSRLADLAPSLRLSGLKHMNAPLWFLTCSPIDEDRTNFPFRPFLYEPLVLPGTAQTSNPLFQALSLAATTVSDEYGGQVILRSSLEIGYAIHTTLDIPTFFFATDDEGLNLAFFFSDSGLESCKIDGNNGIAQLEGNHVKVYPMAIEGEEEDSSAVYASEDLEGAQHIEVAPFKCVSEDDRGRFFQSTPLSIWPSGWPSASSFLHFGTFDALSNYPAEFKIEFELPVANAAY